MSAQQNFESGLTDDNQTINFTSTIPSGALGSGIAGCHSNITATVQYPQYLQIMAFVIGVPVIIFGCIGNFMTLLTLFKTPVLQTPANVFLMSLALSDILQCTVTIPIQLTVYLCQSWPFSDTFCRVYLFLNLTFVGATMWCVAATALGRHFKIIYSTLYAKFFNRRRKAFAIVGICWTIPVVVLLPTLFGVWGEFECKEGNVSCALKQLEDSQFGLFGTLFIVSSLIIPLGIILYSYLRIYCVVMSNHRRVHAMKQVHTRISHIHQKGAAQKSNSKNQEHREDIHFTKTMMCIFTICMICYFPYLTVSLIHPFFGVNVNASHIASMCVWVSASLNPVVYVLRNRRFRAAFVKMLRSRGASIHTNI